MSSTGQPTTSSAIECPFCGKITGYKAVPGSEEEHRTYQACITALQKRIDAAISGLAVGASKERQSRTLDLKKLQ